MHKGPPVNVPIRRTAHSVHIIPEFTRVIDSLSIKHNDDTARTTIHRVLVSSFDRELILIFVRLF